MGVCSEVHVPLITGRVIHEEGAAPGVRGGGGVSLDGLCHTGLLPQRAAPADRPQLGLRGPPGHRRLGPPSAVPPGQPSDDLERPVTRAPRETLTIDTQTGPRLPRRGPVIVQMT